MIRSRVEWPDRWSLLCVRRGDIVAGVNLRRLLVVVLVGALLALVPLAQASPPDQTWIAGFYDDGDHDDVVLLITAGLGVVQPDLVPPCEPGSVVAGFVLSAPPETTPEASRRSDPCRAPPLS